MTQIKTIIAVSAFLVGFFGRADDVKVKCSEPLWYTPVTYDKTTGTFSATLSSVCQIKLPKPGSIAKLDQYAVKELAQNDKDVAGPVSETFEGLPSARYETTHISTSEEEGGTLTLRQDVHIATDGKTRLVAATVSKNAVGSNATLSLIKKIDTHSDIRRVSDTQFNFILKVSTIVAKPALAPVFMSASMVEEKFHGTFVANRDKASRLFATGLMHY